MNKIMVRLMVTLKDPNLGFGGVQPLHFALFHFMLWDQFHLTLALLDISSTCTSHLTRQLFLLLSNPTNWGRRR